VSDATYSDALKDAHAAVRATQAVAAETLAALIGNYHAALIKQGIPAELAADLVVDFQSFQLDRIAEMNGS
jgi:hypothetical protein